jgi:copper transport protein
MLDALAALTKALLYGGLLSASGAVFSAATLRGCADTTDYLAQITRRGALVIIATCTAGLAILIFRLGGEFDEATLSAVFMSGTGAAAGLQLAGAALLLTSVGSEPSERTTRLSNAAIAMASFAFSGHVAVVGLLEGLVGVVHVSAAAWWVGSLWMLRRACSSASLPEVADLVRRFSTQAVRLIGGMVLAGIALALILVDFERVPWLSTYVQMLAVKIGLAVLVLGVAGYNKFRLTPRLATGDVIAAAKLRRMIDVELVLIATVIAATAILTTYFSPHE